MTKKPARRSCTASVQRKALALLPGVDQELAERLFIEFGGIGQVATASEMKLLRVRGLKRELAKRLVSLFACRRGHCNYGGGQGKTRRANTWGRP